MSDGFKLVFAAILAAVGAYMQQLVAPLFMLLMVMLLDYVSGICAAWMNSELSSRVGIVGIVKKVSYLLIVAVGMALDYLIDVAGAQFGIQLEGMCFVGLLVIIWLIINECISILENADEIGLPVPPFIGKHLQKLKHKAEEIGSDTYDG